MRRICFVEWLSVLGMVAGASAGNSQAPPASDQTVDMGNGVHEFIPTRAVDFEAVKTDPGFALPNTSVDQPQCLPDGSLVLHDIDWKTVMSTPKGQFPKYNQFVTIVRGTKTQTISSTSISDLTDFNNGFDVFATDSGIYFLLQATKDQPQPGPRSRDKSPSGIPYSSYHEFLARFDPDGTYKGATRLGIDCDLSRPNSCHLTHLAVFPNGDMLVSESDPETSILKVLYLNSSGNLVKQIDVPASRRSMDWGDTPNSNPQLRQEAQTYLASVYFTAVGDNILVWRGNSDDAVVEIRQGGGVREVPLQIPAGWRFVDMVPSNDRWVVHFRKEDAPPEQRMSTDIDAYYEMRPQDGSLSARIVPKGESPLRIECENDGTYTSFKFLDSGNTVLLKGQ